jgi:hypothetical protein
MKRADSGCGCLGNLAAAVSIGVLVLLFGAGVRAADVDPLMGDWQGTWEQIDGYNSGSLAAEVIALGGGQYRARLLEDFGTTRDPYAVLDGQLQNGKVKFVGKLNPDSTTIDGDIEVVLEKDKFTGSFKGETGGEQVRGKIALTKTVRQSPTLGAQPPAGAVVLFDGRNFDEWVSLGGAKGIINFIEAIGNTQNAVAYLRATIWSPREQKATLLLGSDDGVKVWLNGKMIHAKNVARGVSPDEDKVPVALREGANELLLKVTNGAGDWGAIVRFAGADGKPLRNLNEVAPQFPSDRGSPECLARNDGFLTQWQVAGPYQEGGKGPAALFDVAFAPEKSTADVQWKRINADVPDDKAVKWRLVDGAMEVKPGAGSIATKRKFKDFTLHLEFCTPFMPEARGQGRGNSGVYLQNRYEIQVLDSYGLEPKDNECGGIYQVGAPLVNMCYPPGQWQTYDITFQAPRFDGSGNRLKDAAVTVRHNGVTIHDQRPIPHPTGGALDSNVSEPGGVYLQDHGNLVRFRNIWLVEQN